MEIYKAKIAFIAAVTNLSNASSSIWINFIEMGKISINMTILSWNVRRLNKNGNQQILHSHSISPFIIDSVSLSLYSSVLSTDFDTAYFHYFLTNSWQLNEIGLAETWKSYRKYMIIFRFFLKRGNKMFLSAGWRNWWMFWKAYKICV